MTSLKSDRHHLFVVTVFSIETGSEHTWRDTHHADKAAEAQAEAKAKAKAEPTRTRTIGERASSRMRCGTVSIDMAHRNAKARSHRLGDCTPRLIAAHYQVKKHGKNEGKWCKDVFLAGEHKLIATVRNCPKHSADKTRCTFFLWDRAATAREVAARAKHLFTEPVGAHPDTPLRPQPSVPLSQTGRSGAPESSQGKRKLSKTGFQDDHDFGQVGKAFEDEMNQVRIKVEEPESSYPSSIPLTPPVRRKLSWQAEPPTWANPGGLHTPQTEGRSNSIATRPDRSDTTSRASKSSDVRQDMLNALTPSPYTSTPTPSQPHTASSEDLVQGVFDLLQDHNVRLDLSTQSDLRTLLSKHAKNAEGIKRGRDVIRSTVKARDARITELTYRVSTLEAELEAEKALVKHLKWEAGSGADND